MASRRIAFVTPQPFAPSGILGGGERYATNLARGIVRSTGGEYSVDIISFGGGDGWAEVEPGVRLHSLPLAATAGGAQDPVSWSLPQALEGYDLVHLHQAFTRAGAIALVAARIRHQPVVLTHHGGGTLSPDLWVELIELSDAVVAYSEFGARSLGARRHVDVIRGGVDGDVFQPTRPQPQRRHVLFVGRLLPHKGVDRLIAAMPSGVPLILCGQAYSAGYAEILRDRAAGRDVRFVHDADDARLRELYASAHCVVLPSEHIDIFGNFHPAPELMGFSLLEAMACATPAVCSRVGGMPEFVEDGVDGFVYDSADELRAAISRLAADSSLADRMGAAGRRAVEDRWDMRVAGSRMAALYAGLLTSSVQCAS
jgi:glycosyltransferase involved in cell wall biosynthesis